LSALISYLNVELAERTREHGVLVEVFGEGILILGGQKRDGFGTGKKGM